MAACVISTSAAKKYVGFQNDAVGFRLMDALKAVSQVHIEEGVVAHQSRGGLRGAVVSTDATSLFDYATERCSAHCSVRGGSYAFVLC